MQPLLIIVLLLAFWPPLDPPPVLDIPWTLGYMLLGLVLCRVLAELPALYLTLQLRLQPGRRWRWLWIYFRWRQIHLGVLTGLYIYALLGLHWATFIRREAGMSADLILMDEFFILLPFLLGLLLSWDSFYRVERALHQTEGIPSGRHFWRRPAYLAYQIRQHLGLVMVPLTLFLGLQETAHWFWPNLMAQTIPQVSITLAIGMIVLVAMPWLLTKIFHTTSLPDGPLRERLTAAADRLRFPFSDIRMWHTRAGVANAMVTGFLRRPRYVLLSDLLLEELEPDEIEAVFCHEIGHLHHRHIGLYLVFMGLSINVLTQLLHLGLRWFPSEVTQVLTGWPAVQPHTPSWSVWLFLGGALALVGGYIRLVFGALSRSCERQADVYSCKNLALESLPSVLTIPTEPPEDNGHVSKLKPLPIPAPAVAAGLPLGVPIFIAALEKVANLNGIPYGKPSWRHGSIARRVTFLRALAMHPELEPRQQRRWFLSKGVLLLLLAGATTLLWWLGANPLLLW